MRASTEEWGTRIRVRQATKTVAVLGLGKSGMAAARFFSKRGYRVFTSDTRPRVPDDPAVLELEKLNVTSEWGGHTAKVLDSDLIIVSPGLLPDSPILKEARKKKIEIWPEIEAAYRFCPGPIIAITGTNGKSTVAALVGHLMNANGIPARVVGNIGVPLLDELDEMTPQTWAVMETSSFQLETVVEFRPRIACIITITQDHLNRHPDLKTYVDAKVRILENQTNKDIAVLNFDDEIVRGLASKAKGNVMWFGSSQKIPVKADIGGFQLKGEHNRRNLLAALTICAAAGLTEIKKGIDTFGGLPHRLEFVRSIDGVDFYDDSKGTNPDAVARALETFKEPVILIAGGHDKNLDLTPMLLAAKRNVKCFIALGKDNAKILEAFSWVPNNARMDTHDMNEALNAAFKHARRGDVILLSPGCASFDLFGSAEERGDRFQAAVKELKR